MFAKVMPGSNGAQRPVAKWLTICPPLLFETAVLLSVERGFTVWNLKASVGEETAQVDLADPFSRIGARPGLVEIGSSDSLDRLFFGNCLVPFESAPIAGMSAALHADWSLSSGVLSSRRRRS